MVRSHAVHFPGKYPETSDYSGESQEVALPCPMLKLCCFAKGMKASLRWEEEARGEPRDQGTDSGETANVCFH